MKNRIITSLSCCLLFIAASLAHGADKPNVIIILADDQFAGDIGIVNPAIHTPNLDRLAKRGVRFNNCYIEGGTSAAVCTPSRAMLMTGRNLFHLPKDMFARSNKPSLPVMSTVLAKAGYQTFYCGKHGNTYQPADNSFQKRVFINRRGHKDRNTVRDKAEHHAFTDPVITYLANPERHKKPFFIFYSPSVPHDPVCPEPQDLERYLGKNLPVLPPNAATSHTDVAGFKLQDTNIRPFEFPGLGRFITPLPLAKFRELNAWYRAYITSFDRQIGRILDELERTGADKNTLIIFAADNGMSVGQQGLIHKESVYEQDINVPLFICGPGIPKGKTSDALVDLADLFPTLCEHLAIPTPKTVQSKSFLATLTDPSKPHHTSMYHAYREEMRALRDGKYKLILFENGFVRLFDIKADPYEIKDLSQIPAQAKLVARMIKQGRERGKALDDDPKNMPPAFIQEAFRRQGGKNPTPFWKAFDANYPHKLQAKAR